MAISTAKMRNLLDSSRPGEAAAADSEAAPSGGSPAFESLKGLQLSEIMYKPLDWFRYNPDNAIFRECKTEEYFTGLAKDIEEADAIVNPVIAMPDGLLVEGESRHEIASRFAKIGRERFERIPTRLVLSKLTRAQIKERLFLGNLSRFDIPREVKLVAYAQIWPDYFLGGGDGRDGSAVTTKKQVSEATGLSESQIKRDKAVIRRASELAEAEEAPLQARHVKEAQKGKGGGAHDAPLPQAKFTSTDATIKFLKSAVVLLFQASEYTAGRLLLDHFLKKNEKPGFVNLLPADVRKKAEMFFVKKEGK